MSVSPKDLRGTARRLFDTWRLIGMSESATIDMLRRDGWLGPEGVHVTEADPVDGSRLATAFRALGLSEGAARTAVVGHGGEREAVESAARSDAVRGGSQAARRRAVDEAAHAEARKRLDTFAARLEALEAAVNAAPPETWRERPRSSRSTRKPVTEAKHDGPAHRVDGN